MVVVLCDDPVHFAPPIVYGPFESGAEAEEWLRRYHIRRGRSRRICLRSWEEDEHWIVSLTPTALADRAAS